ncbi:MAG TPA: LTA synthase family protein [Clostridiales bacterium]|nr:LTA synthase family protein [Clostridiales bacterium]
MKLKMTEAIINKKTKIKENKIVARVLENEYSYWIYLFISIMCKCLYFQFTTQINRQPYFSHDNLAMIFSSFCILIIITGLIVMLFNRKRLTAIFVLNLIISSILTGDTNFFRYYYGILSIPVILQIDIKLFSSIQQSIESLFKVKDIIYILDIPMLLIWLIKFRKKGIEKVNPANRLIAGVLSLALGVAGFISIYSKTDMDILIYNSNYITQKMGILYSHFDGLKLYAKESFNKNKGLTQNESYSIKQYFGNKQEPGRKYRGIAKDKNLIVIQVEALQEFMINRKVNGVEITPNLNKLINESLYFNNFYYQVAGGNTSDAEFLLNTSLYPAKEGAVYVRFAENTYHSLPEIMNNKGYNTYALHAFTAKFWNRTEMYKTLGFKEFIDGSYYEMDDFAGWDGEALSDASFFNQSLDKIDTSRPFYSFFITLSSHYPFTFFEDYNFEAGELEGAFIGNYIKAINYADSCLGKFIEELKQKGLYNNSLLVVYGDHSGVPKHLSGELMDFLGMDYSDTQWIKLQKVPLIIHYPEQINGDTISVTGGQIDILPTIANLMDFKAPYAMGKDLLNTKNGYVVLRNGTVITENYIYINERGEIYSAKDGKPLKIRDYQNNVKSFLKQLNISDLIIEKNALEYIN